MRPVLFGVSQSCRSFVISLSACLLRATGILCGRNALAPPTRSTGRTLASGARDAQQSLYGFRTRRRVISGPQERLWAVTMRRQLPSSNRSPNRRERR